MARATATPAPKTRPKQREKTAYQRKPGWPKEGARLKAILAERGIAPTQFAAECGVAYHNVYRWCRGFEFTPENQGIVCAVLELELAALQSDARPGTRGRKPTRLAPRQRELEARTVLEAFKLKPIAESLTAEDWSVIKSIRFFDAALRPSVGFYEAVAYALKGAIRVDEIAAVAAENAELDRTLSHKGSLPRR